MLLERPHLVCEVAVLRNGLQVPLLRIFHSRRLRAAWLRRWFRVCQDMYHRFLLVDWLLGFLDGDLGTFSNRRCFVIHGHFSRAFQLLELADCGLVGVLLRIQLPLQVLNLLRLLLDNFFELDHGEGGFTPVALRLRLVLNLHLCLFHFLTSSAFRFK